MNHHLDTDVNPYDASVNPGHSENPDNSAVTVDAPNSDDPSTPASPHAARKRKPRKGSTLTFPSPIPRDSLMSHIWPGTKLSCLAILSSALLIWPHWSMLAVTGASMLLASLVAHVPLSAIPRLPLVVYSGSIGAFIGAQLSGGFFLLLQATLVAVVILWGSLLLVWTTPLSEIPPALHVLLRPLSWVGAPIDEWVNTIAFAFRGLPAVRDHMQSVFDAARLRKQGSPYDPIRTQIRLLVDLTTATLSATSRQAGDTGRALSLRGGVPPIPRVRPRLTWWDALVSIVVLVLLACGIIFRHGWPSFL